MQRAHARAEPGASERERLQIREWIICLRFPSDGQRQQVSLYCATLERHVDASDQEIGPRRLVFSGIRQPNRYDALALAAKPPLVGQEVRQDILR
jgi:hypothetical protein